MAGKTGHLFLLDGIDLLHRQPAKLYMPGVKSGYVYVTTAIVTDHG